MQRAWPWLALVGLGAFHGINPAMGWLFAVALGLHRGSRRGGAAGARCRSRSGHAASVLVVGAGGDGLRPVLDPGLAAPRRGRAC